MEKNIFMKNDLLIVIPVGVSSPGTPIKKYLEYCIDSLKNQKTKFKYKVIFAADNNVSDEIKNIIFHSGFEVKWFEPFYFMRRGGIWKKIYSVWAAEDVEYVSFCHYDDLWSDNKVESQLNNLINNQHEISWCKVCIVDTNNNIISGDACSLNKLDKNSIYGSSYAFCHSSIIKKQSLFESGILDKIENSSPVYEKLQFIYSHKLKGKKDDNCAFFHRVHNDSVTNNFNTEKDYMIEQRKIANYSIEEVIKDANNINFKKIIDEIILGLK